MELCSIKKAKANLACMDIKLSANTLCRKFHMVDAKEGLFALLFINDARTLHFHTTKADQTGMSTIKAMHLYANPFGPTLCVVLH